MSASTAAVATVRRSLEYLPIGLFGSVMGLTGLGIAWQLAGASYGLPEWISTGIGAVAVIAFALITCGYAIKIVSAPEVVRAEFAHPIAGNLFGSSRARQLAACAVRLVGRGRRYAGLRVADGQPLAE